MQKSPTLIDNNFTSSQAPQNLKKTAYLSELFSGIQGEGPLIGQRQIFLRFSGCDLRCQWCDTTASLSMKSLEPFRMERQASSREFEHLENPIELDFLAKKIASFNESEIHHSISLTGGEPLLQADYIKDLIIKLKKDFDFEPEIYLETGGHRPAELAKIIDLINFISFDLKLPSSTNDRILWIEHKQFLEIASGKTGYGKSVLTKETLDEDLETACEILRQNGNNFELILQPAFELPGKIGYRSPSPEQMLRWQSLAIKLLGKGKVRVIPQTHKFIGQL